MKLSCSDYTWPVLSHEAVMAVIADLGFAGVDIGVFHEASHVTLSSVRRDPLSRGEQVLDLAAGVGLAVADVFLTADPDLARLCPTSRAGSDQDRLREIFEDVLTFAAATGSRGVTLLPGVVMPGQSVEDAISLAAEGLEPLVRRGADAGLAVSVEPHVGSCIETPAATRALLDRCPGLMVTLDPSHFEYQGWDVASIVGLIDRTRHVQVRPASRGVMQALVAEDGVDLNGFVAALAGAGYGGWIAAEYVWMEKWNCNRVDNTGETALLRRKLTELIAAIDGSST
jgi:sugar phosphate isomerase/epimerase